MRIKGFGNLAKKKVMQKMIKKAVKLPEKMKLDMIQVQANYSTVKKPLKYKLGWLAGIKAFAKRDAQEWIDDEMRRVQKQIEEGQAKKVKDDPKKIGKKLVDDAYEEGKKLIDDLNV